MKTALAPLVSIVGEWTMGPRTNISFISRPIALPGLTYRVAWGDVEMTVRVRDRKDGISYGDVLVTDKEPKGERKRKRRRRRAAQT